MSTKIRVLVVDDSALVRRILSDAINSAPDLTVAGTAPDAIVALEMIQQLNPDVVTLDLEMPRMDGITFLRKLMSSPRPLPVVVVSSLAQAGCRAALEALEAGAVEVMAKPGNGGALADLRYSRTAKIRAASQARLSVRTRRQTLTAPGIVPQQRAALPARTATGFPSVLIAIGASTGGTEAVAQVLQELPANSPPVLIVQHIPPVFSRAFAQRLDQNCAMRVKEAEDGDPVTPGVALIAPGDYHMIAVEGSRGLTVRLTQTEKVCYQRPAVDVLFDSVAKIRRSKLVGVVLTGMGSDGAEGLLKMRRAGARTLAQDEATCVVFGMPKQAIANGAAERAVPLPQIGRMLCSLTGGSSNPLRGSLPGVAIPALGATSPDRGY